MKTCFSASFSFRHLPIFVLSCLIASVAHSQEPRALTIAVVQTASINGDISANLKSAEGYVIQAASQGAQLVLMPELMPTGYELTPKIWDSAETMNGATVTWMKNTSRKYSLWLGASFLQADGGNFFNTFVITNPDGEIDGVVRKEFPASMEGYFFLGEANPHIIKTEFGTVGVGICYENYLSSIANKIREAHVDLMLMPFSFPFVLGGHPPPESGSQYASFYSRLFGIPVAAANKVGAWKSPLPNMPNQTVFGKFPGTSAISNANGEIVSHLDDKAGFVVAKVMLDPSLRKMPRLFEGKYMRGLLTETAQPTRTPSDSNASTENAEAVGLEYYKSSDLRKQKALAATTH